MYVSQFDFKNIEKYLQRKNSKKKKEKDRDYILNYHKIKEMTYLTMHDFKPSERKRRDTRAFAKTPGIKGV